VEGLSQKNCICKTSKMPPKNKIFLWMVLNDCVLTKENMKKWGWKGSDPSCAFCNAFETRNHLLFQCPVSQHVWKLLLCRWNELVPRQHGRVDRSGCYYVTKRGQDYSSGSICNFLGHLAYKKQNYFLQETCH
jgi:hypothetical protein